MHQENIGTKNSPTEESNEGDANKEVEEEAKEDLHFGERDK